ncbi:hypothetical protein CVT25_013472, partial [Psilocybe cyanescens]
MIRPVLSAPHIKRTTSRRYSSSCASNLQLIQIFHSAGHLISYSLPQSTCISNPSSFPLLLSSPSSARTPCHPTTEART